MGPYTAAVRWIKAARPRGGGWSFAARAFWGSFVAGLIVMSVIGLASPGRFGGVGGRALGTGWPSWVLIGILVLCALVAVIRRRRLVWLVARVREPFRRPLSEDPHFAGAAGALAASSSASRTRFAVGWVWGPVGVAVLGATCAFSTAYFVVDAVLARGRVGWEQPLLAAANIALGLVLFRIAAKRLSRWRLATSVHREVSEGWF